MRPLLVLLMNHAVFMVIAIIQLRQICYDSLSASLQLPGSWPISECRDTYIYVYILDGCVVLLRYDTSL